MLNPLIKLVSNEQLIADEASEADAKKLEEQQNSPALTGIAHYVRTCWDAAQRAKTPHEREMLESLRMRNGEYSAEVQQEIKKSGGTEIYMRVGATKMRAAQSWLKDIFLNIERPFTIAPSPLPELATPVIENVEDTLNELITEAVSQGIPAPSDIQIKEMKDKATQITKSVNEQEAKRKAAAMEDKIDDYLVEGDFYKVLDEVINDITTYKACICKGPIVRKTPTLKWEKNAEGRTVPVVGTKLTYKFERVDPLRMYPSPDATNTGNGFLIERHKMQRIDLNALMGVKGYNEEAIREVLRLYGQGGLENWLSVDSEVNTIVNEGVSNDSPEGYIEAIEYWGGIQGSMLDEWGVKDIKDMEIDYQANVWVIGHIVIRAVLNHDPLGRVPYSVTSWEKSPSSFWGEGLGEMLKDVQQVCNAAARALCNNMAISSGPQVSVNISRLPDGTDITQLYPWKIWQSKDDPYSNASSKPVDFFQPQSNAAELHGVYEKFATIADEVSSIPRYMMGDASVGGAGRTAAGLSMLMNAANKGIKNVANNIDTDIIVPTIERLYYMLMVYDDDDSIKGDVFVRAKGASGLMLKELLNQRRLEFLGIVAPFVESGLIPPQIMPEILKELSQGLDFPEGMLPSGEEFKQHLEQRQAMEQAKQQAELAAQSDKVDIERDGDGAMTGIKIGPGGQPMPAPASQRPPPKQPENIDTQLANNFR
jgi:hypothetical protein